MSPSNRQYELVSTVTEDGAKLHGLYQPGQREKSASQTVDAAVISHGLAGNFYNSTLNLRLADTLVERGVAVVLGNNRGHDGLGSVPVGGKAVTIGAAREIVDDCRYDVRGWVDFLCHRRSHTTILLVGHSLGAIKSLYAMAHQPHDRVGGIVGLSATRLNYAQLMESPGAELFRDCMAQARQRVADGRSDELMQVRFPFPTWMAAGAYLDKYGPESRYDWLAVADQIAVPTLVMFGERELRDNPAFDGLQASLERELGGHAFIETQIIPSANHFYVGVHDRACEAMAAWLERTLRSE